jgi:hypothetical protein
LVFIKQVVNSDSGDADHSGGNDWDLLDQYHDITDITPKVAKINTRIYFRFGKLELRNLADTFSYVFVGSAIGSDKNITIPLLTALANLAFDSFGNTFSAAQKMDNYIDLKAVSEPSSLSSGYIRLFIDSSDGKTKIKRSNNDVVIIE